MVAIDKILCILHQYYHFALLLCGTVALGLVSGDHHRWWRRNDDSPLCFDGTRWLLAHQSTNTRTGAAVSYGEVGETPRTIEMPDVRHSRNRLIFIGDPAGKPGKSGAP